MPYFISMLKDKARSIITFSVAGIAFLEMYMATFPLLAGQADTFNEMMKMFPPEIFKSFGIDVAALTFAKLESYLAMEQFNLFWPIVAIIFAISLAGYVCAGDVEKGTIETLAALPSSRMRIFFERYFAGIVALAVFAFTTIFAVFPLAALHNVKYQPSHYVTLFIGAMLFLWAVYSLSVLASVVFSEKSRVGMLTGGLLMLMYVLNVLSTLKSSLVDLQYLSFFHYFSASSLLDKNEYVAYSILVFVVFSAVCTGAAAAWFNRRDLAV